MTVPRTPDVLEQVVIWRDQGRGVALATVTATWGSSPRPAGSLLAVDEDGRMVGSVSGGCVEGSVVETALLVIASGARELLDFGVSDEMAWEVGLACGGQMQVFVDRVAGPAVADAAGSAWLDELQAARAARHAVVLSVDLASGQRQVLDALESAPDTSPSEREIVRVAREALQTDTARLQGQTPAAVLLQPFNPPLRLIVVGAVHIAQPLCRIASETGYAVTVIDPRGAFASEERFPEVELSRDWPDEALEAQQIDSRTAIVTLTHDPKLDDPALAVALRSPAFYVGSLGSRRTHARRLQRLAELGFDAAALAHIHGPVGLDIGARSASEIALSILAEITARLRGRAA